MTDIPQAIAAVEAALAKMTKGPWKADGYWDEDDEGNSFFVPESIDYEGGTIVRIDDFDIDDNTAVDFEGIVTLRNHVPTLLAVLAEKDAEIERLRALVEEAAATFEGCSGDCDMNFTEQAEYFRAESKGKQ